MPCQDYASNDLSSFERRDLKKRADKLAHIACAAMTELEDNGIAEALLLRNDELREWWTEHKIADAEAKQRKRNEHNFYRH